ncbi:Cellulase (glycosyl hydrolase family 5) [Paenibacillaceae bacterium GAS479]|nr:Cellulase (glycosyl hydrolase family 5) [Paenibacillaceae bacterium GAS479]
MLFTTKKTGWAIAKNSVLALSLLAVAAGCGTNNGAGINSGSAANPAETTAPPTEQTDGKVKTSEKMAFWNEQRKGANFMNSTSLPGNYAAAKEQGLEFIRVAPDKWSKERQFLFEDKPDKTPDVDFLIGSSDKYEGLVEEDFQRLKADLDAAEASGTKVVLTVLSLPGNQWRQFNGRKNDDRMWKSLEYHKQAAQFWKDLAERLKDHPAIVGYNLINEPHPETATGFDDFWVEDYEAWYVKQQNTAADLNLLYSEIVKAVRTVDQETPIMLDSGLYATPWAFKYLKPIDDPNMLYAFHMYEPYEMTSQNKNKGFTYSYPGTVKVGGSEKEMNFDREALEKFLEPVEQWAKENNIPASQIIASEFGINRMVKGADQYMNDLISIFNEKGWHWSFYAYREDTWDGMDYEMGTKSPNWKYWEAIEKGELPERNPKDADNPIWNAITDDLTK